MQIMKKGTGLPEIFITKTASTGGEGKDEYS